MGVLDRGCRALGGLAGARGRLRLRGGRKNRRLGGCRPYGPVPRGGGSGTSGVSRLARTRVRLWGGEPQPRGRGFSKTAVQEGCRPRGFSAWQDAPEHRGLSPASPPIPNPLSAEASRVSACRRNRGCRGRATARCLRSLGATPVRTPPRPLSLQRRRRSAGGGWARRSRRTCGRSVPRLSGRAPRVSPPRLGGYRREHGPCRAP